MPTALYCNAELLFAFGVGRTETCAFLFLPPTGKRYCGKPSAKFAIKAAGSRASSTEFRTRTEFISYKPKAAVKKRVSKRVSVASMGGLGIEAFLPREVLEEDSELLAFTKRAGRYHSIEDYNTAGARNYTQLAGVYNEKVAPLAGLSLSGVVWYLGESSAWDFEFARMFRKELGLLVKTYRKMFGGTFAAVGIACEYYPYGDGHGYEYINEALASLEADFEHYRFVPIHDIEPRWLKEDGELYYHPIHPVNKLPVAERIADTLVRGTKYPRIAEVQFKKGGAVCKAENVCGEFCDENVYGFTLAGADGKYYPAYARASGDVYRFNLCNGEGVCESLQVTRNFRRYAVSLSAGIGCDGSPLEFSSELRRSFVQLELSMRSKTPARVKLRKIALSDFNDSKAVKEKSAQVCARADIKLPD